MSPTTPSGIEEPEDRDIARDEEVVTRMWRVDRLRLRLTAIAPRVAPYVMTIDGVLLIVVGVYALIGAMGAFQGEGLLLVVGGLALILFGSMTIIRRNLAAVRTGLFGLTAGYFASALTEFQVATDPCDIGSTLERCSGHVPGGLPWAVYQGPLFLAILLFVFIAFEGSESPPSRMDQTATVQAAI